MAAYRHIGGSIVWQGKFMDDAEVQAQADLALREHDACLRIGDRLGARVARGLFLEITDALKEQARWMGCTDKLRAANDMLGAA